MEGCLGKAVPRGHLKGRVRAKRMMASFEVPRWVEFGGQKLKGSRSYLEGKEFISRAAAWRGGVQPSDRLPSRVAGQASVDGARSCQPGGGTFSECQ